MLRVKKMRRGTASSPATIEVRRSAYFSTFSRTSSILVSLTLRISNS
jgi:hypothetical protein